MARTPFKVEVLTPEGEVFNDEVEMVSTRTSVGSIGILANHQPLLAMLDPTELRLYKSESEVIRYAQGEGFLQMTGDRALVLVDEVFKVDDLNASDLRDRLQRAEDELSSAEEGTEERRARRARQAPLRGLPEARRGRRRATSSRRGFGNNEKGRPRGPFFVLGAPVDYGCVVESVKVSVLL